MIMNLFAGPGGWDVGAEILGITGIHGYDRGPGGRVAPYPGVPRRRAGLHA